MNVAPGVQLSMSDPSPTNKTASPLRSAARWIVATLAIVCIGGWLSMPARAASDGDPQAFVENLGGEVLAILKSPDVSQTDREKKFRELFLSHFDVPTIGRFVIGRYWNRSSKEQQDKYLELFGDYVASIYAAQFAHYQGEGFKTLGVRKISADEAVVKSEIERPGNPPIAIEFRVKGQPGAYKIDDVGVEGVSLIITKRDEFSSVLSQEGLDGVMNRMRTAVKQVQAG